jgi:hypothetical protein
MVVEPTVEPVSQFEGRATYAYEFDAAGGITAVLGAGCGV